MPDTGLVILAAGASRRLGHPKQLALYRDKPLLQHAIDAALSTQCASRVLVLGANADTILKGINTGSVEVKINERWEEGMAGSIRCGLNYMLTANSDLENVLFMLCDQPHLTSDHLNKLLAARESGKCSIMASLYDGHTGVPAMFERTHFEDLMALTGDQGARKILLKNQDHVQVVPFEKGEIDIDTPDDYQKLIS